MGGMGGFSSLNETQKKKLPAWIRAGLEKMEMDKLKKEQEEERKRRTEEKKRLRRLEEAEEVSWQPTISNKHLLKQNKTLPRWDVTQIVACHHWQNNYCKVKHYKSVSSS